MCRDGRFRSSSQRTDPIFEGILKFLQLINRHKQFKFLQIVKEIVLYEIPGNPGRVYTFSKNSKTRNWENWRCTECAKYQSTHRGSPIASIRISYAPNELILSDPVNPPRPRPQHGCAGPLDRTAVSANQITQEARKSIRSTGKKPQAVYIAAEAQVTKRHANDHLERAAVEEEFDSS